MIERALQQPWREVVALESLEDHYWVVGYSKVGCARRLMELSRCDHSLWESRSNMAQPFKRHKAIKDVQELASALLNWRKKQDELEKKASAVTAGTASA